MSYSSAGTSESVDNNVSKINNKANTACKFRTPRTDDTSQFATHKG